MKIGFIGMGNMPYAILKGILKSGFITADKVFAFDTDCEKLKNVAEETGINAIESSTKLVELSELIIMSVKPAVVPVVLKEINDVAKDKPLLSIAYNVTFDTYKEKYFAKPRIQFIVPNIPCMELGGMTLFEDKTDFTAEEESFVRDMFLSVGEIETLPAKLMPVAGGLTSCGPAFVAMAAEALADAIVLNGIPYKSAYRLAAQLLKGTGNLLSTGELIPAELKNNVCSPGGYTIKGVKSLEEDGFRAAIIHAVEKTMM